MAGRDLFADTPKGRDLFAEPPSLTDQAIGYAEPALTFASGLVAEPAAGIAGIGSMGVNEIYNMFRNGRPTADVAADTVAATREAFTYQPRTELGQENLQAVGEALAPVAETIQNVEQGAGDIGYELGGESPVMGAIGQTLPTAALTALGLRPFRNAVKTATGANKISKSLSEASKARQANKLIKKAAPTAKMIKKKASGIYDALDESGAVIKSDIVDNLSNSLKQTMTKEGFHPKLNQPVAVALDEFDLIKGQNVPVGKLDQLRKFAQGAAGSIDPPTKRLGTMMLRKIDDTMDRLKPADFKSGGGEIGKQYKQARDLWGRSRRSEMMTDVLKNAENAASGTENGIRIEMRKILRSPKKSKFFSKGELDQMRKVADGTFTGNIAKAVGKLGFDWGKSTNTVGAGIGIYGGSMLNPYAAVAVPAIGTASRILSKHMTKNGAKMADAITRAGKDGVKITREYMNRVPKKDRSVKDLTSLLIDSQASLKELRKMPLNSLSKQQKIIVKDAILAADAMQQVKDEEN